MTSYPSSQYPNDSSICSEPGPTGKPTSSEIQPNPNLNTLANFRRVDLLCGDRRSNASRNGAAPSATTGVERVDRVGQNRTFCAQRLANPHGCR